MQELHFRVPGMTCGHCVAAVRRGVLQAPGVESAEVDLTSKDVLVRGVDIDVEAVWAAVDEAGYEVEA